MKLKIDENLGHRTLTIQSAGHDVTTVPQQNISGISDRDLIDLCTGESRALITAGSGFCQSPAVQAESVRWDSRIASAIPCQPGNSAAHNHDARRCA